jgi:hypothetical protein
MWQHQYFTATKRNAGPRAYSLDKKPGMESPQLKRAAEAAPDSRHTRMVRSTNPQILRCCLTSVRDKFEFNGLPIIETAEASAFHR